VSAKSQKFILYRRVSSSQQGNSGLGLEGQASEIQTFLDGYRGDYEVIEDLVEVQSGKDHLNRPVLQEALKIAASTGAMILVSRLCRLSRDLEFIAGLMKSSKVSFRIATNPHADEFTIGIYAVMGLQERKLIGLRTKAALAAAKARGVKLGTTGSQNIKKANEAKVLAASRFADQIRPVVLPLREAGKTYQQIADALNHMDVRTPQGKRFYPATVQRYLRRMTKQEVAVAKMRANEE
jgi:DNA invertase Pin-like site-specific DNA recombinase